MFIVGIIVKIQDKSYSIQTSLTETVRHDLLLSSPPVFHMNTTTSVSIIQNQTQQIFTNTKLYHYETEQNQKNESKSSTLFELFPTTEINKLSVNTVLTVLGKPKGR